MVARRRNAAVAAALVLSLFALFHLHGQYEASSPLDFLSAANEDECSFDSSTPACALLDLEPEPEPEPPSQAESQLINDTKPVIRTGPAQIVYPAGYERFSLKNLSGEEEAHALAQPEAKPEATTLLEKLEQWVPYISQTPINRVIYQTWHADPGPLSIPFGSWRDRHMRRDSFKRYFVNEGESEQLMARLSRDMPEIQATYDSLPARVLKLDLFKYATLFKDGGVYADFDTLCYKPVEDWLKLCGDEQHRPGFIVGIDMDLLGDPNFEQVDGRDLLLADYLWVARKGHPILRDLLSDIATDTPQFIRERDAKNASDVRVWTGRVRFTDTVIRHVQKSLKGFSAQKLHGLKGARMFGDVCVLQIAAFGSGQHKFSNSPETESSNADVLAKHYFMKSWEK